MKNVGRKEATISGNYASLYAGGTCPCKKALLLFPVWNNFPQRKVPLDFSKFLKIWIDAETVGNFTLACIFLITAGNLKL